MNIHISSEFDGKTVKEFLFGAMKLSNAMVARLKKRENGILICGAHVTVRAVLHEGDVLSLSLEDRKEDVNNEIIPVKMDIEIAYEDEYIIVVNKPGNMPVHPSHNHHCDSLANGIKAYYEERGYESNFRAVNRLDRDTSGLVIVAKDKRAAERFSKLISEGGIEKSYLAVLSGTPESRGRIHTYIKREKESIIKRCNCFIGEGGSEAVTDYILLSSVGRYSLVAAEPETGRTHQLRVHFAGIGHPIIGDSLYGSESLIIGRQALHAYKLAFVHPFTGSKIVIKAELPDDIKTGFPEFSEIFKELFA